MLCCQKVDSFVSGNISICVQGKSTLLLYQCVWTHCQQCSSRQCLCNSMPRGYLHKNMTCVESNQPYFLLHVDPSPVQVDSLMGGSAQQDQTPLTYDSVSSYDRAVPSASHAKLITYGVPLFTRNSSVGDEEMKSLLLEAKEHATSIYDEASAREWAGAYTFPPEYVRSDIACLRAAQQIGRAHV